MRRSIERPQPRQEGNDMATVKTADRRRGRRDPGRRSRVRRHPGDAQIRLRQQFLARSRQRSRLVEADLGALKTVMMAQGAIDPLVKEMIYIAVSTANGCSYCIHSHTAAARAKGMTDAQHGELVAIIGLAGQTNHLVTAMQIPVDPEFSVEEQSGGKA